MAVNKARHREIKKRQRITTHGSRAPGWARAGMRGESEMTLCAQHANRHRARAVIDTATHAACSHVANDGTAGRTVPPSLSEPPPRHRDALCPRDTGASDARRMDGGCLADGPDVSHSHSADSARRLHTRRVRGGAAVAAQRGALG